MSPTDMPPPPSRDRFYADEIILYGVRLNTGATGDLRFSLDNAEFRLRLELRPGGAEALPAETASAMAVVYGYASDGHCYRLERPKILVFVGVADEGAVGCGFDAPADAADHYRMWRIRAKTELFELGGGVGTAEDLILQARQPGRRAPSTYAIDLQLGHRTGRPTRPGDGS